ncbi:hypothetical protein BGW38_000328 [Lunasporangiospora selenospora]|uniref:SUN domain-containing protein n=1 Tax=Lunasporangiospora selenospora TaxID=979761 RepID=A0A9P6FVU5_9FUNG|nr:hypothetical protein BGW38_000328 [Lunasporangiospora selenospora]
MTNLQFQKESPSQRHGSQKVRKARKSRKECTDPTADTSTAPVSTQAQHEDHIEATNFDPEQLYLLKDHSAVFQNSQCYDFEDEDDREYYKLESMVARLEDDVTCEYGLENGRLEVLGLWGESKDQEGEQRIQDERTHFRRSLKVMINTRLTRRCFPHSRRPLVEARISKRYSRCQRHIGYTSDEDTLSGNSGEEQNCPTCEAIEGILGFSSSQEPIWRDDTCNPARSATLSCLFSPRILVRAVLVTFLFWMLHKMELMEYVYRVESPHGFCNHNRPTSLVGYTCNMARHIHCNFDQAKGFKHRRSDTNPERDVTMAPVSAAPLTFSNIAGKSSISSEMWSELAQVFVTKESQRTEIQQEIDTQLQRMQESKECNNPEFSKSRPKNKETNCPTSYQCLYSLVKMRYNNLWPRLALKVPQESGVQRLQEDTPSIDTAFIPRAIKDNLASRDYALHSSGARILRTLTWTSYFAPTITYGNNTFLRWIAPWLSSQLQSTVKRQPPELAISPGIFPGECWAMKGAYGQIAIKLARRVVITGVTIEHADPSTVLDEGTAPKEIEVWGLDTPTKSILLTSFLQEQLGDHGSSSARYPLYPGALLLGTVVFKAPNARGIDNQEESRHKPEKTSFSPKGTTSQTFAISSSMQRGASTVVIFRIKSNWGHPQFTCLYKAQVHGLEEAPPERVKLQ